MRKFSIITLMLLACMLWNPAQAGIFLQGAQIPFSELKPGVQFVLQNATAQGQVAGDTHAPGSEQWLSGDLVPTNKWSSKPTLKVDALTDGFNYENVFELEEGPVSESTGAQTYYLKCVGTGKYVSLSFVSSSNFGAVGTDKANATPLELADAAKLLEEGYQNIEKDEAGDIIIKSWEGAVVECGNAGSGTFRYCAGATDGGDPIWWNFGPAWNYGFAYVGNAKDIVKWSCFAAKLRTAASVLTPAFEAKYEAAKAARAKTIDGDASAPAATSEYFIVPGMKEACDALDALMADAQEKIDNKAVKADDILAMQLATQAVNDLYIDRSGFDAQLAATLADAKNVYKKALDPGIKLIASGDQFSSNLMPTNGYGDFGRLLDGEYHYNKGCESYWDGGLMQKEGGATAEEWAAKLASAAVTSAGIGYHNIQVALTEPVDHFWIEQYGRNSTAYRDTPSKYDIYATNDADVAANTDNANSDQWVKIAEDYVMGNTYGSNNSVADYSHTDVITLGDSYKYLRFVVKSTITVDAGWANRAITNPDVTGIVWNMSEFQLFQEAPAAKNPINYDPDLKSAAEAVNALIEEYSALPEGSMINSENNDKLVAAVNKLKAALANTADLSQNFDGNAAEYYYIYKTEGDNLKALSNNNGLHHWQYLEKGAASNMFRLVKGEGDNLYYIQSVLDGSWLFGETDYYIGRYDVEANKQLFRFEPQEDGLYKIRREIPRPANPNVDQNWWQINGNNNQGMHGQNRARTISLWTGQEFTVEAVPAEEVLKAKYEVAMREATKVANEVYSYTDAEDKLVTSADQFYSTNQEPSADYSSYANLIDGDLTTVFQTTWSESITRGHQWIQIDMGKAVDNFKLQYGLRNGGWGSIGQWTDITVYATNSYPDASESDNEANKIENIANNPSWTNIGTFTWSSEQALMPYNRIGDTDLLEWHSFDVTSAGDNRWINAHFNLMGNAYRYVRFYVNQTAIPAATPTDWSMGELQAYESTKALPYSNEELADAVEELEALIISTQKAEASQASIDALNAAVAKVKALTANEAVLTIGQTGYATYVSDKAIALPEGLTAYYASDQTDETVTLTAIEGNVIAANTPVVLAGDAGNYVLASSTEGGTGVEGNLLQGSATTGTVLPGGQNYVVADEAGVAKFCLTGDIYLAAGKAYLPVPAADAESAQFKAFVFEGATGIKTVSTKNADSDKYFDLQGRRVLNPSNGIYIKNNKKVYIK